MNNIQTNKNTKNTDNVLPVTLINKPQFYLTCQQLDQQTLPMLSGLHNILYLLLCIQTTTKTSIISF
jgi:hypothetical protein